ncbi:hypothetical protein PBI_PIPEFISH_69 [Mycobacterium phage Pipefish]|uniref:Uncharacterized protein n=1 Tax=Mycobacterium phage Pipefish TaxID=373413 RepID=Q19YT6_9CAUD|nr:gp69 [Mycobacterium phage Pipefish]ABD58566.1 hypothetical protein PBI_PIPEFISH_69 [Mycobacterium phage Pipefish]
MTMDQFADTLDQHAGRTVGFADHVRALRSARAVKAAIEADRKTAYELMKAHYSRGNVAVGSGSVLRMSKPSKVSVRRTVDSKLVQRRYPKVYDQCRVPVPYVTVAGELTVVRPANTGFSVASNADLDRVVAAYRACSVPEDVTAAEAAAVAALKGIADEFGWDGLPLEFTDAWTIGLRRLQFDAKVLRELRPDVVEECSVERSSGGSTTLRIVDPAEGERDHEGDF